MRQLFEKGPPSSFSPLLHFAILCLSVCVPGSIVFSKRTTGRAIERHFPDTQMPVKEVIEEGDDHEHER